MKTNVKILTNKGTKEPVGINRRRAIRLKCLDCSAWSWSEVENCEHKNCDLYPFRTGKGAQNAVDRRNAIRSFCVNDCMIRQEAEVLKCVSKDSCPLFIYRLGNRTDNSAILS